MINFSLFEMNLIKTKSKLSHSEVNQDHNTSKSFLKGSCFLSKYSNNNYFWDNNITEITDITGEISKGKYGLRSKFTIIYLYDYIIDTESIDFISTYGGKLHNISSSNISILTYFSQYMVNNWSNVHFREELNCEANDYFNISDIIKDFQNLYNISKLPAIVVVKKDDDDKEKSCSFNLTSQKKEDIFTIFKDLIEIINNNCEEDFSIISSKICGSESNVNNKNNISNINTFNYVYDLVKDKSKKGEYKYTQFDLAAELNISIRCLRDKRTNNTFTRDECFYIAIRFEISIQDLKELLRLNNHRDLEIDGRDGVIRMCLVNHCDIYETQNELHKRGYPDILKLRN